MPGTPHLGVSIDFANGPAFGNPLILDDPTTPLGTGILADAPGDVVDVSDIAIQVSIRRGRNRILNKFEAGTAVVVLADDNGDFSPANISSPYYGKLLPLRKIRIYADYDDGGGTQRYYLYSGYITTYNSTYGLGVEDTSKITLQCVDGFRLLNGIGISTVAGAGSPQLSGDRLNTLLDVVSWPESQRDINSGNSTLQADPGTSDRDLLSAIQLVESSEFGGFFLDAEGNATFLSRDTISQKADETPTVFADDGTGITYQQIEFANDDTLLVNDVTVTRLNSVVPQNVFDQPSIDTYFLHSGKRDGILVQTDAEALDQAQTLLVARKDTTDRIDSMTLNLLDSSAPTKIVAGLNLEIFDLVNVTKTVPGGSTITKELFVQGVQHDITQTMFTTKLLTSEPLIQAFILDSTTSQGRLGSGILSY
jgi:hypothetical protein